MANEAKLQKDCIKYLEQLEKQGHPLLHFRRDTSAINYRNGLPDIWCVVNGHHLEIEFKDPDGKPSSLQLVWERKFKLANTPYLRTSSFDEFKNFILKYLPQ